MRIGKWVLGVAALALLVGGTATAQYNTNQLCLHNGGDYYYFAGPWDDEVNAGGAKYFPSFTHWASVSNGNAGVVYPWKIVGWSWWAIAGPNVHSDIWWFETFLHKSKDNPNALPATFPYPRLFCLGQEDHRGFPNWNAYVMFANIPPLSTTIIFIPSSLHPTSANAYDQYLNIFAAASVGFLIPSTQPLDGYIISLVWDCDSTTGVFWVPPDRPNPGANPITVPSAYSVTEYVHKNLGPTPHYLIFSFNESDCLGGAGNKCRNYSYIPEGNNTNGYTTCWYYTNGCGGVVMEYAFCLHVCDSITIPVNIPGAPNNIYAAYGFDVGVATIMPYITSSALKVGFFVQDRQCTGKDRMIMGAFGAWPCIGPYGKKKFRLPHGWDPLTDTMVSAAATTLHKPVAGWPGCMVSTICADTALDFGYIWPINFNPHPALICNTIRWCSFSAGPFPPTASFMATYF